MPSCCIGVDVEFGAVFLILQVNYGSGDVSLDVRYLRQVPHILSRLALEAFVPIPGSLGQIYPFESLSTEF